MMGEVNGDKTEKLLLVPVVENVLTAEVDDLTLFDVALELIGDNFGVIVLELGMGLELENGFNEE